MNTKAILTPEEQENYLYNTRLQQEQSASEKEIETELYALLIRYYRELLHATRDIGAVSYSNPHNIDGLLTLRTLDQDRRLLIEAKTHSSLTTTGFWAPLSQALQYVHLLSHLGELLPGIILIATEREWHTIQVDSLAPLLSRDDLPWESVPSMRAPEIESALQELNPSITSHVLNSSVDLNEALGGITSLLMESRHHATKHHGNCSIQSKAALDVDPTTHLYHAPSKQWWRHQGESGIWAPIEQRDLTMELRDQAIRDGVPSRGIGSLVRAAIEEGRITCATEKWPSVPGLINTPLGTWNPTAGEMSPSIPQHNHRHITGEPAGNVEGTSSSMARVVARALRGITGLSTPEVVYCITQDESGTRSTLEVLSQALGTYAVQGDSHFITSQWKWSPDRGDAPILLVDGDVERSRVGAMTKGVLSQERLKSASMVVVLSEASYEAQKGVLDQTVAITWVENVESDAGQVLGQALRLMSEPVNLVPYENNDLVLAWFNGCLERKANSYVLLQDAFDSFNDFLTKRGNSAVSQRYFISAFIDHIVFRENQVSYEVRKRVKSYTQSQRKNKDGSVNLPSELNSIFLNVAFRP